MRLNTASVALFVILGCLVARAAGNDLAKFDSDGDGLLTKAEAQAGGQALFARLDANQSGGLDAGEIGGRLGEGVFRAADVNADGELGTEEYAGLLEARFKSAHADGNGAVDARELDGLGGALLLVMMRQ